MRYNNIDILRIRHSAFRIHERMLIYIDPFQIAQSEQADLIFITHEHFDHCSIEDLRKVSTKNTTIIVPPGCQSKLSGKVDCKQVVLVKPGVKLDIEGIKVEAVAAYNLNKQFHPKENEWVGYVLTLGSTRIYHAGDTDVIPEMAEIENIDVALLPVSGTYVMTANEAAKAAALIKPKVAVPMHYGAIIGTEADAQEFKQSYAGKTEIL